MVVRAHPLCWRPASLFDRTVEFLLLYSGAADKAVRFRCCQLLGALTTEYTQRPQVDEEDLDCFVDVLLPRLRDKVAAVRVQAVGALRPFQFGLEAGDDEDALKDDKVRSELMRAMVSDSSPDVRQAALAAVTKTVGMFDQVSSKLLSPQQRVTLVKRGLSDSSEAVVDACRFMVCVHWFRDAEYDPMELLQRLDVVNVEKVPELVVAEIVRLGLRADRERGDPSLGMGLTLHDAKALRQAAARRVNLTSSSSSTSGPGGGGGGGGTSAEEALYARVQAEVVKDDKVMSAGEKETRLETILTDTMTLCGQIEVVAQEVKELVSKDVGDNDARVEYQVFVLEQDVDMLHHTVESSMVALAAAHTSEADFVRIVAELVSDISDLIHTRPTNDVSPQNVSLNASFASIMEGLGDVGDGTPNRSFASMRSAVRAAIPKNFVKDRARAIEGIAPMACMSEEGGKAVETSGGGSKRADPASSEDEFMDALSHHSGAEDAGESNGDALRQVTAGLEEKETVPVALAGDSEQDMRRLFRILDILSVLLSKTKRTLARDATLTAFEDVIMDVFKWTAEVLPTLIPDLQYFGPTLREQAVQTLGKYSLLGEAAAVRHSPMLLKIALCEDEATGVRACAMQALSDLSLIFRSAVLGSTGDVLNMFADILKDRSANRGMTAVAAEAISRLLFFELSHDPELLARLIVLYFEKGSAADPSVGPRGDEDGEEEGLEEDAKAVGSSVRLSQILGVYFRSLPSAGPRVRDMLSESVRHVMGVLRGIAELNVAAEKNNENDANKTVAMIEVPSQDVVKFVRELLMVQQEESALREAEAAEAAEESSSMKKEVEEEGQEEKEDGKDTQQKAKAEKSGSSSGGTAGVAGGVDATGHVALCITEELWTLSGIDGVSELAASLAKVLTSLPLPEDDQVTLKRLRKNVDRLESLGDSRLGAKVSRVIAKYAEVLLAADPTPDDSDSDGSDSDEHTRAADKSGDEAEEEQKAPARKKRSSNTASSSPSASLQQPSRRPFRQSKVAARERMAHAEAEAVAAAAAAAAEEEDRDTSEDEDEEESDGEDDGTEHGQAEAGDGRGGTVDDDDNAVESEDDDEDDGYESAVTKVSSPAREKRSSTRRKSSRAKASPLAEISNSPGRGRRLRA
ncbi:unnamed protein product [Ectocarpus sp. CCAP 1310/34]|nr:unnamed protein product [Ectocarpus sp. CCAP 1310/34]